MGELIIFEPNWPEPDYTFMAGGQLTPVPPFPLEALGPTWSEFIEDAAGSNLPRDFFAMNLLGTVSGLIGNGLEAVMPQPSAMSQPATLWTINIGQPGAGKTPAFLPFLNSVNSLEATSGVTRKIEDATIAGVLHLAGGNTDGLVVMNDELSGWWDTFKRDRQGEQFWLKAWNGNLAYTLTRAGRNGGTFTIPRLNIAVVGGSQPATLPTMLEATRGVERGFVARCLFSFPDRPENQTATGKSPDLSAAQNSLARVFGLQASALRQVPVTADAAAYHDAWTARFNPDDMFLDPANPEGQWVIKQDGTSIRLALVLETLWWSSALRPDNKVLTRASQLAALADPIRNDKPEERDVAQQKLDALIAEFGLSPHGTWIPSPNGPRTVTLRAMKAACDMIESYFYAHFVRCQSFAFKPVTEEAAKALVFALVKARKPIFNARLLQKYVFGKVHPALHGKGAGEVTEEVCAFLEERAIIKRRASHGPGRKPKDYDVNPKVLGKAWRATT